MPLVTFVAVACALTLFSYGFCTDNWLMIAIAALAAIAVIWDEDSSVRRHSRPDET